MNKAKVKKILNITSIVLLYLFIAICLFGVILTITAKKDDDGTATIFGKQMRIVISPSMEKCDQTDVSEFKIKSIPVKSMVFIDVVPEDPAEAEKWYADLKVGDVLTFKYVYTRQETITHRITAISKKPTGGYLISLQGDNKNDNSDTLTQVIDTSGEITPFNYVVGKVTGKSFILGWFISTLKSKLGIILMVIVPAFIIMMFEIIKIFRMFSKENKEKFDKEKQEQLDEIEELKRKLAALESKDSAPPQSEPEPEAAEEVSSVE